MYAMTSTSYWAHSAQNREPNAKTRIGWQPLAVHLRAVSNLARTLAQAARPTDRQFAELAALAGWLHDFGKYSDDFQRMLVTGRGRPQHAIHGGMLAMFGTATLPLKPGVQTAAAAITGHHAGLADWNLQLSNRLLCDSKYHNETESLVQRACADIPEFERVLTTLHTLRDATFAAGDTRLDLFVRMLFSCLVDADRLDSAGRALRQEPLKAEERLKMLLAHTDKLKEKSPEGVVKEMRARVLDDCLRAAASEESLFSLSVPTGGGKTLAAMAFALHRAGLFPERFRRVIVVIPYLSIIEQNADVYAEIFGKEALLEHHSGCIQELKVQKEKAQEDHYVPAATGTDDEKEFEETGLRPETENWDAPLIVTTSVRFFESLFSNRPADLRRVHNIARSIVILDEVQTFPRQLLGPLLGMMKELTEDWGVNFVFSTATLPAFERPRFKHDLRWPSGTLTEIVSNPEELRHALQRVRIDWKIETPSNWTTIAECMMAERQCLAIVNLRDHANQLYAEALRKAQAQGLPEDSIVHLSTRMCAAHRLRVIQEIRERLKTNQPCYVVSTQLVEAGVDLDFPLVLRALAPLDSIVQAAGRADREGKLTAAQGGQPGGRVIVFLPEENKMPPNEYKEAAGITEAIAKQAHEQGEEIQVDSAKAMHAYFERYYCGVDDKTLGKELVEDRQQENFATLADKFEMISSRTRDVFVLDDPKDKDTCSALEQLRDLQHFISDGGKVLHTLRTKLQRHTVGLSPSEFERARNVLERVTLFNGEEIWIANEKAYDKKLGLTFEIKVGDCIC
jgi:CRISPR-associated endonuclease/helicase Cas3